MLLCEGDKSGHEMLRHNTELGDHVLHVEWRFVKLEGEPAYNSGIYVRTSADGAIWHQAQTGPTGGFLFGNTLVNGAPQRVNLRDAMTENRVKPAGEWNTYEITAKGPTDVAVGERRRHEHLREGRGAARATSASRPRATRSSSATSS